MVKHLTSIAFVIFLFGIKNYINYNKGAKDTFLSLREEVAEISEKPFIPLLNRRGKKAK